MRRPDHADARRPRRHRGRRRLHRPRLRDQPGVSDVLTDEIKGKPPTKSSPTGRDVLDILGIEISPARMKCAMLSLETLDAALADLDDPEAASVRAEEPA